MINICQDYAMGSVTKPFLFHITLVSHPCLGVIHGNVYIVASHKTDDTDSPKFSFIF